jgi:hypothetical protein
MLNNTTVNLVAVLHDGRRVPENLLVENIAENRFRLLRSPGLVQGIAAGDEFELAQEEPDGYRLLKRAGNVCLQVFVGTDKVAEFRQTLVPLVERIGGRLDGEAAFTELANLVFTIPINAGFPAIEAVMARAKAISPACEWFYGNVYDLKDGVTPLNWWREHTR